MNNSYICELYYRKLLVEYLIDLDQKEKEYAHLSHLTQAI
jgi:hypothetical protein